MKEETENTEEKEKNLEFNIVKTDVVAITGGGGKTSLMYYLAKILAEKGRVLVTTTTKIYKPEDDKFERLLVGNDRKQGQMKNIDVVAAGEKDNKLIGLSYEEIDRIRKDYDYILIEADGAKEMAAKGWREDEPCIPTFVTKIIGVTSVKSLGKKIGAENIHRLEIFREQIEIDTEKEKTISMDVLERYLKNGKFHRNSNGEKIYFLNAVESEEEVEKALILGRGIDNFYYGSIHNKKIERMKKIDAVVMASGFSSRFGREDKLLVEIDGKACIENLLLELKKLSFNSIVVVGRKKEIRILAEKHGCTFIENNNAHLGQSESVKLGVKNTTGDAVAFFPGDQPYLKGKQILEIIKKYQNADEICLPIVDGKPNTPVIFPMRYKEKLLKLEGDTGGREIIRSNTRVEITFEERAAFKDIDCVEDIEDKKSTKINCSDGENEII